MSKTAAPRAFGRRFRATGATVAAVLALAALVPASAAGADAARALSCEQKYVYGVDQGGALKAIDVTTGTVTDEGPLTTGDGVTANNALGITLGGAAAFAVEETTGKILRYDPDTQTSVQVATAALPADTTMYRGAFDPENGYFYTATSGRDAVLSVYDTKNGGANHVIGHIPGLTGSTGDIAFSTSGAMFIVAGNQVRRIDVATMPSDGSSADSFSSTLLTTLPDTTQGSDTAPISTQSPGIAFSTDGYLYVSSSVNKTPAKLFKIDPASGALKSTIALSDTGFAARDLASCNYADTVTATSTTTERVKAGDQFTVTITGGGVTHGNAATSAGTATTTSAGPVLAVAHTSYTVTQTGSGDTDLSQYSTERVCRHADGTTIPEASGGGADDVTFEMPTSTDAGVDVTCTFTNTPKRAPVEIRTALGGDRIDGTDQFAVAVKDANGQIITGSTSTSTGSGSDVTAGTGDSGATSVVVGRAYQLTQDIAAGSASAYGQYAKAVTCTDSTGGSTGLPTDADYSGSVTITPSVGSTIVCTVTAKAAPASIAITTALDDPRYSDDDQFTTAVLDGTGTAVGTPTAATTTGSGDTVDGGTGTSVLATAQGGSGYTLTQDATADGKRYSRTVTCEDANRFQTGLPSGVFTGRTGITPVPGADITCTVSVMLAGSGLRVKTALGDPRFADGDQFTATIRSGSTVEGGPSTTTGTRSTVNDGDTGRITTRNGTAYTITDAPTDHSERYEQTVTCTDLNGAQQRLPLDAPFTGSLQIEPEAGADLVCTVTASAKHAVLQVSTQLGDDRFQDGDQFTAGVQDGDGEQLGDAGTATTAGSGSDVTAGTGTTDEVTVEADTAYRLLGAPVRNADRYDRTISCSEASGLQSDLPSGAFDGSTPFTPQAGTDVSCVVTTTLRSATLRATASLASARADDGDQWTVAYRTGGADGPVVGAAADATTRGSGSTIDAGSGTTRYAAATNAVAYTLTEAVSGHASRYTTSLTCTDARGLQTTGLPVGAAFTGSATITPQAGTDIGCELTTRLSPAALTLHLDAPAAAEVGTASTWTATLGNDGGAAAVAAVGLLAPDGLTYTGVHGTGWTCTADGRAISCTGPDLAGGASDAFTIDLTPVTGSEGDAVLRAAVDPSGTGADVEPARCTGVDSPVAGCDAARTIVGSHPHLVLGVTAPADAAVGAAADWRVTVTDDGNGPAGSAVVALQLPAGLTAVTASGATCAVDGRVATCTVPGPIAAGAATAFTITGTPTADAAGTALVVRGRLDPAGSTSTGDPAACAATDAATGCAVSAPVTVRTGVVLGVTVTAPTQLTEGVPAGYTVTVANSGTGPVAAPVVAVHLPAGLTYRSATGADCTATGGDLACTLPGALAAGGTTSLVVTVVPDAGSAGTTVTPAASVSPSGTGAPRDAGTCTASSTATGCAVAAARTIGAVLASAPTASTAPTASAAPAPTASGTPAPTPTTPVNRGLLLTGTVTPVAPAGATLVPGDRVRYAFTVTNRTGAALNRVTVTVPGLGEAECRATTLAAGASTTCVLGPVAVTQAQVDAGTVARDATATGDPVTGAEVVSNTVTLTAPVETVARITAVQTVQLHDRNGDGVAQLGERVTFSVRVTNTGTVTLRGVKLDDRVVALTCPRTTLRVGESMVCTGDRITTAADVAAGGIRNVAVASATGVAKLGTVVSQRTVGTVHAAGRTTRLAHTGSNLTAGLLAGGVLLGLGGVLLVAARRRRRAA